MTSPSRLAEIRALEAARAALAEYDAPRCRCPLGAEMDEFGSVFCPSCRAVYGGAHEPCPSCGWTADFYCDKPVGHESTHGSGYHDEVTGDHLRAALAEVDRLARAEKIQRAAIERVASALLSGVDPAPDHWPIPREIARVVAERDRLAAEVAWWEDHEGRTRAEVEADEKHDAEWERISALSDEEVRAELAAEGIDPDESRRKVFDGVIRRMAGGHAALRKITSERDSLRAMLAEARASVEMDQWSAPVDLLGRIDAALAGGTPWWPDHAALRALAEAAVATDPSLLACEDYLAAASPVVVLGLLDEIERMRVTTTPCLDCGGECVHRGDRWACLDCGRHGGVAATGGTP